MAENTIPTVNSYWFDRYDGYMALAPLLIKELEKDRVPTWQIVKIVSQWCDYQSRIEAMEEQDSARPEKYYSKTFVATFLGYEDAVRNIKSDGTEVGTKTTILLEGKNYKTGKLEEQSITTGFYKYNLSNRNNFLFEMAQANSLRDKIESTPKGAKVLIRKVLWRSEGDNEPLRYASDFFVLNEGEGAGSKGKGGNRKVKGDNKVTLEDLADEFDVDAGELKDYLRKDELKELLRIANDSIDDAEEYLEDIGFFED